MAGSSRGRVLVAGASGVLGRQLVSQFKRRGWWVRTLCRLAGAAPEGTDEHRVADIRNTEAMRAACDGVDTVFSTVGASLSMSPMLWSPDFRAIDYRGNLNLLTAAKAAGVTRFGYASVFRTPDLIHLSYIRAHIEFEDALQDSGLAYSILQPTGYFSAFSVIPRIVRYGVAPLIGDGSARTNPIHEADLAEACVNAIEAGEAVVPIGGPDIFTRQEVFDIAFAAAHKKPRYVKLPRFVMGINRLMITPFDPRLSQVLAFFERVNTTDIVAPPFGTHRLPAYLKAELEHAKS
ncbi:MAG: SDR family oxidoreductase [Rhodothermales bacterium]|nr:SDR family oxidoreductase [Rhodothermales bacterium]